MKNQEDSVHNIQAWRIAKDPSGLTFKLAGKQHVYQINGIKAGEEFTDNGTQMRRIVLKESQYPGRKFIPSIEKSSARKDQQQINSIQCLKLELATLASG